MPLLKNCSGARVTRQQAYAIVTVIVCRGKGCELARKHPQLAACVGKDNYVDAKRFNRLFPVK
jgi:hypothetical protein